MSARISEKFGFYFEIHRKEKNLGGSTNYSVSSDFSVDEAFELAMKSVDETENLKSEEDRVFSYKLGLLLDLAREQGRTVEDIHLSIDTLNASESE